MPTKPTRMRDNRLLTVHGLSSAAVLTVMGAALGWLCLRTAAVEMLPPEAPAIAYLAPHDPDVVLRAAAAKLVANQGVLPPATLAAVRRAAQAAPLDARAFLILGHQQWLDGDPVRAVSTLEAGQRLDPRLRLIHLLLLDRYLRSGRYADAATQFSLLARLVGSAQGTIANAMAAMSTDPQTRNAVRATLRRDAALERAVLVAMARSGTPPATLFNLVSPAAMAGAADKDSWGPALIRRLVEGQRFDTARSVWQRVYRIAPAQAALPIFNAGFTAKPSSPPFDWALTANSIGAADIRNGSLAIDYYGRDSGDLATQLLVLAPGRYRFAFTVDPGKSDAAAPLFWTLDCAKGDKTRLMNVQVVAGAAKRRIAADVMVPVTCPAQTLTLRGEAGEFPAPSNVTVRDLDFRPAGARP